MAALLSLSGVSKTFGRVPAVVEVSLAVGAGRVHAVIGENGAGKSTLFKVAAGILAPDRGEVTIDGAPLRPHSAREAIRRGVAMVQQHFGLVGALTVLENVVLGDEPVGLFGGIDLAAARSRAERGARELGANLPWGERVDRLGVGDRQRVAIARALARDARVLILDEPTAVLTPVESQRLYEVLRRIADTGTAVVVITHRLDEVALHADDVSVLRRGRLVSAARMRAGDPEQRRELVRQVMGEGPAAPVRRTRAGPGPPVLEIEGLRVGTGGGAISLVVCAGEVVGVAGVEGNGQRELVRAIAGLDAIDGGAIRAPACAVVHEDRQADGLVLGAALRENLVLGELARFTRLGLVDPAALAREAAARALRGGLGGADPGAPVSELSGGTQQKVVVARALSRGAPLLVLAHPTRGMDAAAAAAVHGAIGRAADEGAAVLVVSADLAELRSLCDRIAVLVRGRVAAEFGPEVPDERFGDAMLGS